MVSKFITMVIKVQWGWVGHRVSMCLSHAGIVSKWLNVESRK